MQVSTTTATAPRRSSASTATPLLDASLRLPPGSWTDHAPGQWMRAAARVCNQHSLAVIALLVAAELVLNLLLIRRVAYTEVDWATYMQQIDLVARKGERDYANIRGDTGPLVYPAGHVWIYHGLYLLTSRGANLRLAQHLFALLYCSTLLVVFLIYRHCKLPVWSFPLLCLSKRLHSIYVLRLFNDPFAMLFVFGAILALLYRRPILASALLSMGIAVKMNALLYLPAFLYHLAMSSTPSQFLGHLAVMASIQVALAIPFMGHWQTYLAGAFNIGRVFLHVWTVNWRFVPEYIFTSPIFARFLLVCWFNAILALLVAWNARYDLGLRSSIARWLQGLRASPKEPSARNTVALIFATHLVGMVTARSLHYQFYSWYAWTLPFLVQETDFAWPLRVAILVMIEMCWNTFPSTNTSSLALLFSHLFLLSGVLMYHFFHPRIRTVMKSRPKGLVTKPSQATIATSAE